MAKLQKQLGANLRRIRLDSGLTQDELALRSGIDARCTPLLESGTYSATVTMIEKLGHALGIQPASLLALSDGGDLEYRSTPEPLDGHGERCPNDVAFGRCIRRLREDRGLTQQVLAVALGISVCELDDYEGGVTRIAPTLLARLANTLEVPLVAFLDIE